MEPNTSLSEQLEAYKAGFVQRAGPERVAMMEAATADLRATGIESQALKYGAQAPDLTMPDALNQPVVCPHCGSKTRWCLSSTAAAGARTATWNCGPGSSTWPH
jgi:hypothetical protein